MSATVTLILGGARSGKSEWAERLATRSGRPVVYLATAVAGDAEMAERIVAHRRARPPEWRTVEATEELAVAVRQHATAGDVVVVDCLTLWVSNVLLRRIADAPDVDAISPGEWATLETDLITAATTLVETAREIGAVLVLVSNEVGLGIVPAYPLGRRYRDVLGRINRAVAHQADSVLLMIAGLPVDVRRLVPPDLLALLDAPGTK